jgi:hypothetical protein
MVFVADVIPAELRRIVEFLNEQMDPAEVLAVEIRQFVGEGMKTLVPRVMGQTAEAEKKKKSTGKPRSTDEVRLAFWSAFCETATKQAPEIAPGMPSDGARMEFSLDDPDLRLTSGADRHVSTLSVGLRLQGRDAAEQWEQLNQYLQEASGSLKLPWACRHGKKGKGFLVNAVRHDLNLDDEKAWDEQHKWIITGVREIRDVLVPKIKKVD